MCGLLNPVEQILDFFPSIFRSSFYRERKWKSKWIASLNHVVNRSHQKHSEDYFFCTFLLITSPHPPIKKQQQTSYDQKETLWKPIKTKLNFSKELLFTSDVKPKLKSEMRANCFSTLERFFSSFSSNTDCFGMAFKWLQTRCSRIWT